MNIQVAKPRDIVVFDVETQKLSNEVIPPDCPGHGKWPCDGWKHADQMLVSVAVTWDARYGYQDWHEKDVPALLIYLNSFSVVVGWWVSNFDYDVLSHYDMLSLLPEIRAKTFDAAADLEDSLGFHAKLDLTAQHTLHTPKSADGLQAVKWWHEGNIEAIRKYCQRDVYLTLSLLEYGKEFGKIYTANKKTPDVPVEVSVTW